MALTAAQIDAILQISSDVSLITGAAVITDVSNYAGLGIATPDEVKILLYIQDSTGQLFYKNAGYDAADFSNPDLEPLTTPTTYSFTLPTVSNGDYLQGQYTVNFKVQVTQGSDITETYKALYMTTNCCDGITVDVRGDVSFNTAEVSVTDYTRYGTWTALTNTIVLYPPTNTDTPQTGVFHGTPATMVYEPTSGFPYTGTWQWTLTSDITYTDPVTQTSTTCRKTGQGHFEVEQSELCKVRCLLDKYRTDFYSKISVKTDPIFERNWNLAIDDYMMAFASERCGMPQTTINKYIDNIYKITGIDPDCDCGCDDGTSQPLVPTSIINGADGADGSKIYSGSGVPSGGLGVVGDYYINTANGDMYKKTGASTWTFLISLIGATGATGATGTAGADGASGVAVLHNDITDSTTTTNALQILKTYSMTAGQLAASGDMINIRARFKATKDFTAKLCYIYLDGAEIFSFYMLGEDIALDLETNISRTGAAVGKADSLASRWVEAFPSSPYYGTPTMGMLSQPTSNVSVSAWASALDITIRANDQAGNPITCELFQVTFLKKV